MNRIKTYASLTLIAIALGACQTHSDKVEDTGAAVTALVQRWSDAGEARQWDVIADTYAEHPGFTWIEQGDARYVSRAAIVQGLEQAKTMDATIKNDVADIQVTPLSPSLAAYRADYFLDVKAQDFGYTSDGVLSGVAIKQGSAWRFLTGSFSEKPKPREE